MKENIDFIFLQETILPGVVFGIVKCLGSLRDFSFCSVPTVGRSGGLLCLWKSDSFDVISSFSGDGFLGVIGHCKGCPKELTIVNVYRPRISV